MAKTFDASDIKKLKLLFTVVDRNKGEFYLDVLTQFEINCQLALGGLGTANSEIVDLLGLNRHKAVLISVVRDDMMDEVMKKLEQKFETVRNGKGIAFSLPVSDVTGLVKESAQNEE